MFDVKMDFKRKSRWVNYGYRTPVYLEAPTSKKHFIICDADLHGIDHASKRFMVVRALYGGKISGIYFQMHLCACMDTLGFTSYFADPDVWMRNSKFGNGTAYYQYVLLYVDYWLVVSDNADNVIQEEIGKYIDLKQDSIMHPDLYLGGHMIQVTFDNGVRAWASGSSQ